MRVRSYNKVVESLRHDIKLQDAVYRIIEKLDRPFKKSGVPGNTRTITGGVRNYFPKADLGFKDHPAEEGEEYFNGPGRNINRFLSQTVFYPKYAPLENYTEWQKEYENRPVTNKFHPDKGYKYDVPVGEDEKYPHVADRMGYPEILGTPFERLMR